MDIFGWLRRLVKLEAVTCHICGGELYGHYVRVGDKFSHIPCHDKQLLPPVVPAFPEPVEKRLN